MEEFKQHLIGRKMELAQLDRAIGPGDDGLRLAMLTGPSGLGKTTLARAAWQNAIDRGFKVAAGGGRAGSLSAPFVPWCEALPQLTEAVAAATAGAADVEQLGVQLVALLSELCAAQPVLLVFDDAHALDESSLALLPYAAGVGERLNLTLLLIEQSDAVGVPATYRSFADGLIARRVVQHLELGPMTEDATAELVASVLSCDLDAVPAELVQRAQGNPWFAKELAAAHARGDSDLPVSISATATTRMSRLDENARDIVSAVALCPEGAYIGWLEVLSGQRPRQFARTMEAIKQSGLVREDEEIISVAHPLMQQALLGEISSAMRRALHLELAETIAEVPMAEAQSARAQGYHLACAGKTDEAAEQYVRAADANEIQGQLHEVVADLDRALEAEQRTEHRVAILKRVAFAAMQVGDDRTAAYWAELAKLADAQHDNELYAYALLQRYWTAYEGAGKDWLERAASLGSDTYGWAARAAAMLCLLDGDFDGAVRHDERALELARSNGDVMLETMVLDKLGNAYAQLERLDDSIASLRQAITLAVQQRLHSWALLAWGSLAFSLDENLEPQRALAEARAALKYVDDLSLDRHRSMAEGWMARALVRCGHIRDGLEMADRSLASEVRHAGDRQSALIQVLRAMTAADSGNMHLLSEAAKPLRETAETQGFSSWVFEADLADARLKALSGDHAAVIDFTRRIDVAEPTSLAIVAQWVARLGALEAHEELLVRASELRRSITSTVPLVQLMLREIDAVLAISDGGHEDLLIAVADEWQAVGRPIEALRSLTVLAVLQAKKAGGKASIERLREVRAKFADLGVEHDADMVAARLRALGARSRAKSRVTNVGNLTKRELEIARLVASGLRNSEVAGQLFLAEKTVAAHLSNIYGKLEIKSRVQLAAWLKENDSASAVA